MSRTKVVIGATLRTGDFDRTTHPVTVRYQGADHSARVTFALVNKEVPFGVGECSDEAFAAIVAALDSRRDLADLVRAARGAS